MFEQSFGNRYITFLNSQINKCTWIIISLSVSFILYDGQCLFCLEAVTWPYWSMPICGHIFWMARGVVVARGECQYPLWRFIAGSHDFSKAWYLYFIWSAYLAPMVTLQLGHMSGKGFQITGNTTFCSRAVQKYNKEINKAPHHWRFASRIRGWQSR